MSFSAPAKRTQHLIDGCAFSSVGETVKPMYDNRTSCKGPQQGDAQTPAHPAIPVDHWIDPVRLHPAPSLSELSAVLSRQAEAPARGEALRLRFASGLIQHGRPEDALIVLRDLSEQRSERFLSLRALALCLGDRPEQAIAEIEGSLVPAYVRASPVLSMALLIAYHASGNKESAGQWRGSALYGQSGRKLCYRYWDGLMHMQRYDEVRSLFRVTGNAPSLRRLKELRESLRQRYGEEAAKTADDLMETRRSMEQELLAAEARCWERGDRGGAVEQFRRLSRLFDSCGWPGETNPVLSLAGDRIYEVLGANEDTALDYFRSLIAEGHLYLLELADRLAKAGRKNDLMWLAERSYAFNSTEGRAWIKHFAGKHPELAFSLIQTLLQNEADVRLFAIACAVGKELGREAKLKQMAETVVRISPRTCRIVGIILDKTGISLCSRTERAPAQKKGAQKAEEASRDSAVAELDRVSDLLDRDRVEEAWSFLEHGVEALEQQVDLAAWKRLGIAPLFHFARLAGLSNDSGLLQRFERLLARGVACGAVSEVQVAGLWRRCESAIQVSRRALLAEAVKDPRAYVRSIAMRRIIEKRVPKGGPRPQGATTANVLFNKSVLPYFPRPRQRRRPPPDLT